MMSDTNETREQYIARLDLDGFKVVAPLANELFIDIDCERDLEAFNKAYPILMREVGVVDMERHASPSGGMREHITIKLPIELEPLQRIAFQGALGSDPTRELLSILRHMHGDDLPTLFREPK